MGGGGGPARAVIQAVQTVAKAAAAPVVAAKDIAQGKNVGQALTNAANTEIKGFVAGGTGGFAAVNSTPVVGKVANSVTGNLVGSTTNLGADLENVADGNSAGNIQQDAIGVVKGAAITGAEYATFGAAGAGLAGAGIALSAGNLTGKLLNGGNFSAGDALSAASDLTGSPELGTASDFYGSLGGVGGFETGGTAGAALPAAPQGYTQVSRPQYVGQASLTTPILITVALAGVALLILKKGKILNARS
jgi:hypothetical protein